MNDITVTKYAYQDPSSSARRVIAMTTVKTLAQADKFLRSLKDDHEVLEDTRIMFMTDLADSDEYEAMRDVHGNKIAGCYKRRESQLREVQSFND